MCWELFWTLEINQLLSMSESCLPLMPLHSPLCALYGMLVHPTHDRLLLMAMLHSVLFLLPGTPFLSYLVNIFLFQIWLGWYCLQEVIPVTPPSLAGLGVSLRDFIMFWAYVYCETYSNTKTNIKGVLPVFQELY